MMTEQDAQRMISSIENVLSEIDQLQEGVEDEKVDSAYCNLIKSRNLLYSWITDKREAFERANVKVPKKHTNK